jgi:uncharacterized protein
MSGLLALLDDVAAIAKVAAASVDDIAAAAGQGGDQGRGRGDRRCRRDAEIRAWLFEADRELPIIWRIALGSLKNKLVILLPALLALDPSFPWPSRRF